MPSRSTLKLIGLLFLLPALVAGLLPLLAEHSDILNGMWEFDFQIAGHSLVQLIHTSNDQTAVYTSRMVWVIAAVGELFLIAMGVFAPKRADTNRIKIRE